MVKPIFTHDCEHCEFLGTVQNAQTVLVTNEVVDRLTSVVEGKASIADLNRALGVKPVEFYDLYFCAESGVLGGSVIARYEDNVEAYKSSPLRYVESSEDEELLLAARMVKNRAAKSFDALNRGLR